jgi:hypothetical protein
VDATTVTSGTMKWSDQVEDEGLTSDPAYDGCRQRRCQKVESSKVSGGWELRSGRLRGSPVQWVSLFHRQCKRGIAGLNSTKTQMACGGLER